MLAIVLVALAGCGGDEKTARQYIEAARQTGKEVAQNQAKLQGQAEQLTKFAGIQNPTPQDYAAMQKFSSDLVALVDAINQSAQKARVEYEKVLDLNGVDKYKRYAEVQIETLGLVDKCSNLVKDFGAVLSEVLQAQVAGQPINEAAVTA